LYLYFPDTPLTYNVIMRCDRATIVAVEKAISVIYSECEFVAVSSMQCARAILPSVACPAL